MSQPGWYNDNQYRDYPFITRTDVSTLPSQTIVEFCAIMDIDAAYDDAADHFVYLHAISRVGSILQFNFRTNAPEAANTEVLFIRDISAAEFAIEWEDASTIVAPPFDPLGCVGTSQWQACLITGDLSYIAEQVADGETITYPMGVWKIEPARVQSLHNSYLRSVTLANAPRTITEAPDGCSLDSSAAVHYDIIQTRCLQGPLQWREGFNCSIRQDRNANALVIGAGVGIGEGMPCAEIPLYPEEPEGQNSPYLSGGPACNEIIKSINGVTGAHISLVGGHGFRVQPDPTRNNRLVIDMALDDFVLCLLDTSSSSAAVQGGG